MVLNSFKTLGNRYLKQNKRRSIITVVGCLLVAMFLYTFLNTMCGWLDKERAEKRKENDYEIVVISDDLDARSQIINEDFVDKIQSNSNITKDDIAGNEYETALYLKIKNVYKAKSNRDYLEEKYGVEAELNEDLLWTYGISDGSMGYILILGAIFIAVIFSIVGVGILRNSIQISAMERIRDYGILRCVGATKKQIKAIIFRESFILETIGVFGGILSGFLLSIQFCKTRHYPVAFHIIPFVLLLVTFYGDMFFAINDGIKSVLKVSPIESVRGNCRIKTGKIKRVKGRIWKKLFGVEGDYAYKNIKRNNGRFIKTTIAMAFGLVTVVVIGGIIVFFKDFIDSVTDRSGYYQEYCIADTMPCYRPEEEKAQLYTTDTVERIENTVGIDPAKRVYSDTLFTAQDRWVYEHLRENYKDETLEASLFGKLGPETDELENKLELEKKARKEYRDSGKGLIDYSVMEPDEGKEGAMADNNAMYTLWDSSFSIYGYDKKDFSRYKDYLIDGTTELSENGVILVNQAKLENAWDVDTEYLYNESHPYEFTDLKVGDEIVIVDEKELKALVREELKRAEEYDKKNQDKEGYHEVSTAVRKRCWVINSAREKLIEEGKCRTLVVEGIVSQDPNHRVTTPTLVVPIDRFYEITDRGEMDFTGYQFHISNIYSSDLSSEKFVDFMMEEMYDSSYLAFINGATGGIRNMIIIGAVALLIVLINVFNAMNVTISSLQLRRGEFAQLRAIGMSKKSLTKSVILEGGIVWIISSVAGLIIGLGAQFIIHKAVLSYIINSGMHIFWWGIIITMVLELFMVCGTNLLFFRQLKLDVATELSKSGE